MKFKIFAKIGALCPLRIEPGGGVAAIFPCTGCAIFSGAFFPFFERKINFGVSFLVRSQVIINFGVPV